MELSIIVPYYNQVSKLHRLLKSIPSSNGVEVLVIDDHSSENIEKYQALKKHFSNKGVTFLQNDENKKGAGSARNVGLRYAKGKWILFADADDFFLKSSWDNLYKYFNSDNEVIFFAPISMEEDTKSQSTRHLKYRKLILDYLKSPIKENQVYLRYQFSAPWSKLIKKDFLDYHKIQFDETMVSNDIMFSTKVGYYMNKFDICKQPIYCITKDKGSLTTTLTDTAFITRMEVLGDYYNFLEPKLTKKELRLAEPLVIPILISAVKGGISQKAILKGINILKQNNIKILRLKKQYFEIANIKHFISYFGNIKK